MFIHADTIHALLNKRLASTGRPPATQHLTSNKHISVALPAAYVSTTIAAACCTCACSFQALISSLDGVTQPTPATQATRQRLLQLVRCIIELEAASSSIAPYSPAAATQEATTSSSSASAACRLATHGPGCDNPLQDALAGVGWEHAARAPLVVAALQVLSELQGAEYQSEVLHLFPALCRLMSSSHQLVRVALSKVFSSRDFLTSLPAAGALTAAAAAAGSAAAAGLSAGQAQPQQTWQQVQL